MKKRASSVPQYGPTYDPIAESETFSLLESLGLDPAAEAFIPYRIMASSELTTTEKGIYAVFCVAAPVAPELTSIQIAELCSLSVQNFRKHRNELIRKGYLDTIIVTSKKNRHIVRYRAKDHIRNGEPGGTVVARILADQYLTIIQKGIYAYLQTAPTPLPPVNTIAAQVGSCPMQIYRAFHLLAGLTDTVPSRWVEKVSQSAIAQGM